MLHTMRRDGSFRDPAVGLCAACRQARRVESDRGSVFWRCMRAASDTRFAKYPHLPVLRCPGFESLEPMTPHDA